MTKRPQPNHKPKKPPGHADPDEYARFLEAAKQVEASDDPKDFDEAFTRVASPSSKQSPPRA
jgi:hypothetical protein